MRDRLVEVIFLALYFLAVGVNFISVLSFIFKDKTLKRNSSHGSNIAMADKGVDAAGPT